MLAFGPLSSAAVSALPDYLLNALSATFAGRVTYQSIPYSPYLALVNGQTRIAYTLELSLRVERPS